MTNMNAGLMELRKKMSFYSAPYAFTWITGFMIGSVYVKR